MDDYVKESVEVSDDLNFGEAYDKELALNDEGKREGKMEIAKSMLYENIPIETISKCTGLTEEYVRSLSIND